MPKKNIVTLTSLLLKLKYFVDTSSYKKKIIKKSTDFTQIRTLEIVDPFT